MEAIDPVTGEYIGRPCTVTADGWHREPGVVICADEHEPYVLVAVRGYIYAVLPDEVEYLYASDDYGS